MTNSIYSTYINVYYGSKGFGLMQIGLLGAIGPISSVLIQPLWAILCDRATYRVTVLKTILLGTLLSVLLYPFVTSYYSAIVATVIYMFFSTAIYPIGDSIAVDKLHKLGFKFSTVRMGGTIGYIIVVVLTGFYFKKHLNNMFYVSAIFFLFCLTAVCFMEKEKSMAFRKEHTSFGTLLRNKKLLFILVFIFIISIAMGFNNSFLSLRIRELHYSNDFVGYACAIAAVTEIPILLVITKFYKKIGIIKIILFAGLLMSLRMILCSRAAGIEMILIAQLLHGLTFMTVHYSTITYMNDELPPDLKSFGQSLLAVFQSGFGSIIGSIGGGYISDVAGIAQAYAVIGFAILAITLLSILAGFIRYRLKGHKLMR